MLEEKKSYATSNFFSSRMTFFFFSHELKRHPATDFFSCSIELILNSSLQIWLKWRFQVFSLTAVNYDKQRQSEWWNSQTLLHYIDSMIQNNNLLHPFCRLSVYGLHLSFTRFPESCLHISIKSTNFTYRLRIQ
jgi:hypothetical protein